MTDKGPRSGAPGWLVYAAPRAALIASVANACNAAAESCGLGPATVDSMINALKRAMTASRTDEPRLTVEGLDAFSAPMAVALAAQPIDFLRPHKRTRAEQAFTPDVARAEASRLRAALNGVWTMAYKDSTVET